jgi:protein ImuB
MLIDMRDRAGQGRPVSRDRWRSPTAGAAAHALARFSRRSIFVVGAGSTGRELKDLPVAALRLPGRLVQTSVAKPRLRHHRRGGGHAQGTAGPSPGPGAHPSPGPGLWPARPSRSSRSWRRRPCGSQGLRRADRRARDPGPLCHAAGRRALRGAGGRNLGAKPPGRLVLPGRQPHRDRPHRHGGAVARRQAAGQAALREAGERRSGLWRRQDAAGRAGAEPLAYRQDEALGDKRGGGRPVRPDRHPVQPPGQAEHVYRLASADSDLPERSRAGAPALDTAEDGLFLAGRLAAPDPVLLAPEPIETVALLPDAAAGLLHLARACAGGSGGPMVQSGCLASGGSRRGARALARLLPGRGRGRRALLDLSRRRWRGRRHRHASAGSWHGVFG